MEELFKRLTPAIVVTIVILAFAIWAITHLNAAPGSRVVILWGLVDYQKTSVSNNRIADTALQDIRAHTGAALNAGTVAELCSSPASNDQSTLLSIDAIDYYGRLRSETSIDVQSVFEQRYLGKFLRLEGFILSLEKMPYGEFLIMVRVGPASDIDQGIFSVSLKEGQDSKVSHMSRGEPIIVQGRLSKPFHLDCGVIQ